MFREALKDQPGVLFTAYRFPHPLLENPIFYLRTSGGTDPIEAIKKAVEAISQKCDVLTDIFLQNLSDST